MVITTHGIESVKVQYGDTVIVFNPPPKKSKNAKPMRHQADAVLVSLDHDDMNGVDSVQEKKDSDLFIADGPGEFEVGGVFIEGFLSESSYGGEDLINTIYKVNLEGMSIVHLGALKKNDLSPETMESLDSPDVLFVPIGGDGVMGASEASKFSLKLSPSIIVPIHFDGVGKKDSLKTFLKEEGEDDAEKTDKLTIRKSDVLNKEGDVVVIEAS